MGFIQNVLKDLSALEKKCWPAFIAVLFIGVLSFGFLILLVLGSIAMVVSPTTTTYAATPGVLTPTPTPRPLSYSQMTHEQLISAAVPIDYEGLYRNNEDYVGKLIVIDGEVLQVGSGFLRVATKRTTYDTGYSGDIIYVNFDSPKIMEHDRVTIYGDVNGKTTYTTVLGARVTVPEITGRYVLYEKGD